MSNTVLHQQYLYVVGIRIPVISTSIRTGWNSLAMAQISVDYSPHIIHLKKYTKFEVFESINREEPTLQFDGVIVGINRTKNINGNVSVTFSCLTDGVIWNNRRQTDIYIDELLDVIRAGTGDDIIGTRIDSIIENYTGSMIINNGYDVGAAGVAPLTSYFNYINSDGLSKPTSYQFIYNGKEFRSNLASDIDTSSEKLLSPKYYTRFLTDFKLRNKVYGLSTTQVIKDFFKYEEFFNIIGTNIATDVHGEHTFWQIAANTWNIGYHEVFDIPNPTFIGYENPNSKVINLDKFKSEDGKDNSKFSDSSESITVLKEKKYSGLAQYIIKPRSIFAIPMKCNIIWPDQIIEENIFIDLLNEPSRVRYIREELKSVDEADQSAFLTETIVGPNFFPVDSQENYFKSFNKELKAKDSTEAPRSDKELSDYEKEFGVTKRDINLSSAYDSALFSGFDTVNDQPQSARDSLIKKIRKYVNYQFAEKYFSPRGIEVQLDPSVEVVPGMTVVLMSETGQHIIAYCLSYTKTWNAAGGKNVTIQISHPRWISEKTGDIASETDPLSSEANLNGSISPITELEFLLGTSKITENNQSIADAINSLYKNTRNKADTSELKKSYKRRSCTYSEFIGFHLNTKPIKVNTTLTMPFIQFQDVMPADIVTKFDSTPEMKNLSNNSYMYYDTIESDELIEAKNLSSKDIVEKHLNYVRRSANRI